MLQNRQTRRIGILGGLLAAWLLVVQAPVAALCCPFCGTASLTLAEQMATADAAVLVQWIEGVKPLKDSAGSTTYEIVQAVKGPAETVKAKSRIKLDRFRAGKPGDLFLVLGSKADSGKNEADIIWGSPVEVTETSFNYVAQAPTPEAPPAKRLAYFVKFLEYPDPIIANDAFGEIANAPYKDVASVSDKYPRDKLRQWIASPETPATRLGLYGMMLGLCGDASDAKTLEAQIVKQTDDFRLGIDGMMGGYLLLTRDEGLAVIDREKLLNKNVPFSETFSAMQALRFMWTYGEERISAERLRQSMRLLLDRPELADLVIADLARWNDWAIQPDLMKMYGAEDFNTPSIKRAIIRYMLVCSKESGEAGDTPAHVLAAKKGLEDLRKRDPKTVAEAERFFILN